MSWREAVNTPAVRRLLGLAVLCVILIVGGRLFLANPMKVDTVYELGPDARSLRGLTVSYYRLDQTGRATDLVLRKRYNYGAAGAPENENHLLRLKRGRYELQAVLEREGRPPQTVTRKVDIDTDTQLLRIPLQ